MSSYLKYRDKALKNDLDLKTEYDALAPEYDIIQTMIDAWKNFNITQNELLGKQIRYNECPQEKD